MLNANKIQRYFIKRSKDYQSESSSHRVASISSQPMKSLNSFPYSNQNNKTQTCKQVSIRHMKKRKQSHNYKQKPTKSLNKKGEGHFSQQYIKDKCKLQKNNDGKQKNLLSNQKLQNQMIANRNKKGEKGKRQQLKEKILQGKSAANKKIETDKIYYLKNYKTKPKPSNNNYTIEQPQPVNKQVRRIHRCTIAMKQITQQANTINKFIESKPYPTQLDYQKFQLTQTNEDKLNFVAQFLENHRKIMLNISQGFQQKIKHLSSRKIDSNMEFERKRVQQQSSNLFTCNILNQFQHYKLFLINTISEKVKKEISMTKFLYHQDHINQNNIHQYIDGKKNIAIIIQTVDDYLVALFTEPCFQPRPPKGRGLIMSLSERRVYQNLPDKSPIIYDQAYVIFGNADIRIGDKQVHSQFGSPTSYYNCKGDKADILFGSREKKDFQIKHLEIFQVIF